MFRRTVLLAASLAAAISPAAAHVGSGGGSFATGLVHPFLGMDHLLALVCISTWACVSWRSRAVRPWPIAVATVVAMALGMAAAFAGIAPPAIEPLLLATVVVFGLLAAAALRLPTALGMAVIGLFGFVHGSVHGLEAAPVEASGYSAGMLAATVFLLVAGLSLPALPDRVGRRFSGPMIAQVAGACAAAAGLWMAAWA